uniref:ABC-type antimicrobial peptide transport system permease component n=1 Tax=Aetherobacter fasciculatus TaxID=888830 RepID=A0A3Q8I1Z8_9BACT|nr:ABC-type antimicrobial peptide transport system permease component [Aetherobacter fasciculatus]
MSEPRPRAAPAKGLTRRAAIAAAVGARVDDLRLALSALSAHRLRSGLTLLGIVIGVFTVVAMMSLLNGLQASIDKNMGGLGADVFQIQRTPNFNFGPPSPEIQRRKNITLSQVMALREALVFAKQVGGEVWEGGKEVRAGSNIDSGVQIGGGTPEFFTNNNLPIGTGRGYTEAEAMGASRVIVLGATVADVLFPGANPIGQRVRLGRLTLEVIGTLERQGGSPFGDNPDNLVSVPIALFLELYGTGRSLNITVMARSHDDMSRLQDQAIGAFRNVRGLDANVENDFDMFSNDSARSTFDELAGTVTAAGLVMCAFTLIVGGIGVMNIMLVAVTERTREIGLRKALGARRGRVLMQFVIEAVLLSLFGGVIGVAMGFLATLLARFLGFPAQVPMWAVALGLGVSSGIGLMAGIYPAWRASTLVAADALRVE